MIKPMESIMMIASAAWSAIVAGHLQPAPVIEGVTATALSTAFTTNQIC